MSPFLLCETPDSRAAELRHLTHEFFLTVKELDAKKALAAARELARKAYVVKIHRARGEPIVEVRKKQVGQLFQAPLKVTVTEAEYIILKAIGSVPLKIQQDVENPEDAHRFYLSNNAKIRAKLWNALAYIRRMKNE
jgi:hypothetical protein